jgi:transcriptional regulator GlxA family with amidase domain
MCLPRATRYISAAIRFIRDHGCDGINVNDVLKVVPLSRRAFESRFQAIIGRTPHQEITRRRIERVRELLIDTDYSLTQIAQRAGFQNQEYMSVAFRKAMTVPPASVSQRACANQRRVISRSPSAGLATCWKPCNHLLRVLRGERSDAALGSDAVAARHR